MPSTSLLRRLKEVTTLARSDPPDAVQQAFLSALFPGAAQLTQGRWVTGFAQFAVVVAYLAGVFAIGQTSALWLALLCNAYSAFDAYRYERP
jgi:hypothetical protein